MKKIFIAALAALTLTTSAFAAGTKKANVAVENSFNSDFKKATDVTWTSGDNYTKASFILDNTKMEAFYGTDGSIIGTSRAITLDELPVRAKRTFAKRYNSYTVKEAIHFEGAEEGAYYISAENDKNKIILKISDNDEVSTYMYTKK